jgi:hypothetical protein
VSNGSVLCGRRIGKDAEGSGRALFEVTEAVFFCCD